MRIPTPPGAAGVASLLPALAAALDGSGPPIAPIPTVSASVSNDYVMSLLKAVRADANDPPVEFDDVAVVMPSPTWSMAAAARSGSPRCP